MVIEKYFGIERETAQEMIDATKNMINEKSGSNGVYLTKVFLFDEYAVLKIQHIDYRMDSDTEDTELKHLEKTANTLLDLQARGVNVVPILAVQSENSNGYIVQVRAKGAELYDNDMMNDTEYVLGRIELLSNAPQEHFDKFIADTFSIIDAGILIDFRGKDNFFYDEIIGFQFIDLNTHINYQTMKYWGQAEKPHDKQNADWIIFWNCFLPCYTYCGFFDMIPRHSEAVSALVSKLTDRERVVFKEYNKTIFEKCRTAMINNGIAKEIISEIISSKEFIPQMQLLELI